MHDSPPPYPGIVPNSMLTPISYISIFVFPFSCFRLKINFFVALFTHRFLFGFFIDPPPNYGNYQPQQPQPGYQQPGSYPSYPPQSAGYGQPNTGYGQPAGYPSGGGYPQPSNAGYPNQGQGGQSGYPSAGGYPPQPNNMYPQVPNATPYGNPTPAPSCEFFFICTIFIFFI